MERKEFLLKSCAFCGCVGLAAFSGQSVKAATDDPDKEDWRVSFMQKRFSQMVDFMQANVDDETRTEIIEEIGRFCSQQGREDYNDFKGNLEGFLKNLETKWIEKASFNKDTRTITLLGKKQEACACAFAAKNKISPEFCNCSRGWMKETFSTITGQKAEATVSESLLRGSDRCSFIIQLS
jgi:predicted ArsR family transcriptional regulator